MAGFGGAVKLTGESEYKKALTQITQSLKVVSAEMKATSSAFASGDKSTQDLANASKELKTSLEQQKSALATLKSQLSQMTAEYQKTGQKHQQLVSEYDKEKQKLDEIGKTLGTSSQEYKDQEKIVSDLATEITKSEKAYDAQGKAINDMRIKTANAETTCNQTATALDKLGNEAEEAGESAEKGGDGFTVMKGVLADLASQAVQSAIDGMKRLGSAIVDIGKESYNLYAQNEQLVGGVETLFGESADQLIEYANQAYKTAGLSANQYMEQATSFSATLLQGLGGDTQKAVEYADLAIRDMSDNANKMGTDMSLIQNAYQGFAKDNYTMLDNLKLGYGGTQAEMARLINDSGVLGDAVEVTAETVKDVPFDQIIEAIHKTQQEIGITGTTAEEASATIEGSTIAMKAAWDNLLVGIASGDVDISTLTNDLVEQVVTMGKNMIPRIKQIISGMGDLVTAVWNEVIPALAQEFPQLQPIVDAMNWIKENADYIIAGLAGILAGFVAFKTVTFITGIVSAVQGLFTAVQAGIPIMQALNVTLNANPIGLIVTGITALVAGFAVLWNTSEEFRNFWIELWANIQQAFSSVWEAITGFFTETLPEAFNSVKETILQWKDNVVAFFQEIPSKVSEMIQNVITFLQELPYNLGYIVGLALGKLVQFGADAWAWVTTQVPQIIQGIVTFFQQLPSKIWTWLQNTFSKISQFGENSIKKAKETGKNIVEGVISFVKKLPSSLWTLLKEAISKVGTFATDIAKKAKEGAKNMYDNIVDGLLTLPTKVAEIGKNIVEGLWNGITGAGQWLKDKITGFAQGVLDGMKEALGISSPSKVFRDEVGKYLARGVGVGFTEEMHKVASQMQDSIPTSFDTNATINGNTTESSLSYQSMISAFKEALYHVKIEMDDEEMGRFVDKVVTRLVYQ